MIALLFLAVFVVLAIGFSRVSAEFWGGIPKLWRPRPYEATVYDAQGQVVYRRTFEREADLVAWMALPLPSGWRVSPGGRYDRETLRSFAKALDE
jgi:hypothetical protein